MAHIGVTGEVGEYLMGAVSEAIESGRKAEAARDVRRAAHKPFKFMWGDKELTATPSGEMDEIFETLEWYCAQIGLHVTQHKGGSWDATVDTSRWIPHFKIDAMSYEKGSAQKVIDHVRSQVEGIHRWASVVIDGKRLDYAGEAVDG